MERTGSRIRIQVEKLEVFDKESGEIASQVGKSKKEIKFGWEQLESIIPEDFKGVALVGIATMACIISTILTIELVTSVRGSSGAITLGLGLMWELSKYTFGSIAILHPEQKMRTVLGWTTAVLIFGSVAASLGYLTEMSDLVQENKMVESVEYQDLSSERATLQSHRRLVVAGGHHLRALCRNSTLLHKQYLHADTAHPERPGQVPRQHVA